MAEHATTTPILRTPEEASQLLGVSAHWLTEQARAQRIQHTRMGRRIRFSDDDIAAVIRDSKRVPAATPDAPTRRRGRKAS